MTRIVPDTHFGAPHLSGRSGQAGPDLSLAFQRALAAALAEDGTLPGPTPENGNGGPSGEAEPSTAQVPAEDPGDATGRPASKRIEISDLLEATRATRTRPVEIGGSMSSGAIGPNRPAGSGAQLPPTVIAGHQTVAAKEDESGRGTSPSNASVSRPAPIAARAEPAGESPNATSIEERRDGTERAPSTLAEWRALRHEALAVPAAGVGDPARPATPTAAGDVRSARRGPPLTPAAGDPAVSEVRARRAGVPTGSARTTPTSPLGAPTAAHRTAEPERSASPLRASETPATVARTSSAALGAPAATDGSDTRTGGRVTRADTPGIAAPVPVDASDHHRRRPLPLRTAERAASIGEVMATTVTRRETHFAPVMMPQRTGPLANPLDKPSPSDTTAPVADPGAPSRETRAATDQLGRLLERALPELRAADLRAPTPQHTPEAAVRPQTQPFAGPVRIVELQLQPAALGTLTVTMRLSGAGIKVSVVASQRETATRLSEDRTELTQLIRRAGYDAAEITVEAAAGTGGGSGDQSSPQGDRGNSEQRKPQPRAPSTSVSDGRSRRTLHV